MTNQEADPKRVVAVILARGGSKGIPQKNLRPFLGVPLVARGVQTLCEVPAVDRVVVSTDDATIGATAVAYGAEVPFLRPAHLASDSTPSLPALKHAIKSLQASGEQADTYVLFQATSPCCPPAVIQQAIEQFQRSEASVLRSVTAIQEHPDWMGSIDEGGRLRFNTPPEKRASQRQQLSKLYRLNGAINIYRRDFVLEEREETTPLAFVMSQEASIDIDTELDWSLAQEVLRQRLESHEEEPWNVTADNRA